MKGVLLSNIEPSDQIILSAERLHLVCDINTVPTLGETSGLIN